MRDTPMAIARHQSGGDTPAPLPCPKQSCCNSTTARRTHGQNCTDRGYPRFTSPFFTACRFVKSLEAWTQVHIDKENAVRHAESVDVGHARRLSPRPEAFKHPRGTPSGPPPLIRSRASREKPTPCFVIRGRTHRRKSSDRDGYPLQLLAELGFAIYMWFKPF